MLEIITSLIKGSKALYSILGGAMMAVFYLLGKSKAKEEAKFDVLKENIKHVTQQAQKVAAIQQKQVKIASEPTPDREPIHDWMQHLSNRKPKP